jgi:Raf kinase inhibitor-like YbhB/YbcL family protein
MASGHCIWALRVTSCALLATSIIVAAAQQPSVTNANTMNFILSSPAIQNDQPIARKYTGDGEDVSPPLAWEGAPGDTREFALICDDPDAPSADPWVHWVVYGIPAETHSLPENLPNEPQLRDPVTVKQGKNSWPSGIILGYRGPSPPGGKVHHYHFKVYALDTILDLPPSETKEALLKALEGHVIGQAEIVGTYQR